MGKASKVISVNTSNSTSTTIRIDEYLTENPAKQKEFFDLIDDVVKNGSSIHIQAPTGTGKNTLAIKYIAANDHMDFVYIVPQISIGSQFKYLLEEEGVDSTEFNSKEKEGEFKWPFSKERKVVITTLDSFRKLAKNDWVHLKALIFIDETHTAVQNFREYFSTSISDLEDLPLVGFSGTPSSFVNDQIINMQSKVEVKLNSSKTISVIPHFTYANLDKIAALAALAIGRKGLTIVFLNKISQMENIRDIIKDYEPSIEVAIFNSKKKNTSAWKYLMEHGKIKKGIDIVLINSVATAGVNIENKDIEEVILVGTFDIFGFPQYLGRVRNYTKGFNYIFDEKGIIPEQYIETQLEKSTEIANKMSDLLAEAIDHDIKFFDCKMKSSEQDIQGDALLNAHEMYRQEWSDIEGRELCRLLTTGTIFGNFKIEDEEIFDDNTFIALIDGQINRKKQELVEFIAEDVDNAFKLGEIIKWDKDTWPRIEKRIENGSYTSSSTGKVLLKGRFQKSELLDKVKQFRKIKKGYAMVKTAIKFAHTSTNSIPTAKEKAEFILKANYQKTGKYKDACKFFDSLNSKVSISDQAAIQKHFKPKISKGTKYMKSTNIKIELANCGNVNSILLDDIYSNYLDVQETTTNAGTTRAYIIKGINTSLKDFAKISKWKADYGRHKKVTKAKNTPK